MALNRIHLNKLLKVFFLAPNACRSVLCKDIWQEKAKAKAKAEGTPRRGNDFYASFWADAKRHVFDSTDLHADTAERIELNRRRRNLFPQLRDGFLLWWNERRRWTNAPFHPGEVLSAHYKFPELHATVKVENIMTVIDGLGSRHVIYPYFPHTPALSEEAARLGLWLLTQALPNVPPLEIRILDIIRGRTFTLEPERTPLLGIEAGEFHQRYQAALLEYQRLQEEDDS